MNLTDTHRLMLEAACAEVLAAGHAYRNPGPSIGHGPAALHRYSAAVDYLNTLTAKLAREAEHAQP